MYFATIFFMRARSSANPPFQRYVHVTPCVVDNSNIADRCSLVRHSGTRCAKAEACRARHYLAITISFRERPIIDYRVDQPIRAAS